ncbi:MAG: inositol monophosphatase family protein [Myxococcota bacterium]
MPTDASLDDDLGLAHELATRATRIALRSFGRPIARREKPDGSPVTDVDVEIERRLVDALRQARPADGSWGEELGARGARDRRWILDPIDGTANFIAGSDHWGTHVALECDGEVVLGLITRPARDRLWWAVRGRGAFAAAATAPVGSGSRLRVSATSRLEAARVALWSNSPHPIADRLAGRAELVSSNLDAVLSLAEGGVDAVIDPNGKPWDFAPAVVLVEEAGGRFSNAHGRRDITRGEGCFSNGLIHDELVRCLAG